jgi:hypothetical protein
MMNGLRQGSALSPLLFIIYIDPLIQKLTNSDTGLDMTNFSPHNKIPCFMFVDDLILKASSLNDIDRQIEIVKNHGNVTGCIINLDISKGITISATTNSKSVATYCENHKLSIRKTLTYTYLGAGQKPTSKSNSEHVNQRLSKTHKKLSFMKARGLQHGLINEVNSKTIIQTILVPSLTHAMEAYNLSSDENTSLNHFISKTLVTTHNAPMFYRHIHGKTEKAKPSALDIWNIYEAELYPPSILIERAKFKLFFNTITSPHRTILKHILNELPKNSYVNELTQIQNKWDMPTLFDIMQNKPKLSTFKRLLDKGRDEATEKMVYEILPAHWKLNETTKDLLPSLYPYTNPKALYYRAHHLFMSHELTCSLWSMNTPPTTLHVLLECTNPLRLTQRSFFWEEIKVSHIDSANYLGALPPYQQLLLILNLIESDNEDLHTAILSHVKFLFDII